MTDDFAFFPAWFARMGFSRGSRGAGNPSDYDRVAELLGISRNYVEALVRGRKAAQARVRLACEKVEREQQERNAG